MSKTTLRPDADGPFEADPYATASTRLRGLSSNSRAEIEIAVHPGGETGYIWVDVAGEQFGFPLTLARLTQLRGALGGGAR